MGSDFKQKDEKDIKATLINCMNCQHQDRQINSYGRPCPPVELVKNGGFEQDGVFSTFANWNEVENGINFSKTLSPYEGNSAAGFISQTSEDPVTKTGILRQNVIVTPSCFLVLSFAENLRQLGDNFNVMEIRARVFYDTTSLINYEFSHEETGTGFVFHQIVPIKGDSLYSAHAEFKAGLRKPLIREYYTICDRTDKYVGIRAVANPAVGVGDLRNGPARMRMICRKHYVFGLNIDTAAYAFDNRFPDIERKMQYIRSHNRDGII